MRMLRVTLLAMAMTASGVVAGPAAAQDYAFEDVVYMTCAEAWEHSGEDIDATIEMIRVMAAFSLDKRGLEVTEASAEAAEEFGELIHGGCTLDPEQLLFAVVDRSIRRLSE